MFPLCSALALPESWQVRFPPLSPPRTAAAVGPGSPPGWRQIAARSHRMLRGRSVLPKGAYSPLLQHRVRISVSCVDEWAGLRGAAADLAAERSRHGSVFRETNQSRKNKYEIGLARASPLRLVPHYSQQCPRAEFPCEVSCASDDPHTIPYHDGAGLSSATRAFLSYQPVAFSGPQASQAARPANSAFGSTTLNRFHPRPPAGEQKTGPEHYVVRLDANLAFLQYSACKRRLTGMAAGSAWNIAGLAWAPCATRTSAPARSPWPISAHPGTSRRQARLF